MESLEKASSQDLDEKMEKTKAGGHVPNDSRNTNVDVIDVPAKSAKNGDHKEEKEKQPAIGAAYFRLFKFSHPVDHLLRLIGAIAASAAGAALPLMTIVFGNLINDFNSFGAGADVASTLTENVSTNALYLVYLFIGKLLCVYIHTTCFTVTATRATSELRQAYIRALLRQDIEYFDTATSGSIVTSISTNGDLVQNGLGEKIGVTCQGLAMLVAAYVVAFINQWKLTLVTGTTMPAAVLGTGIMVALDARLEAKILDVYSKAGGLVEEALSSIKIVTAFGAVNKLRSKYDVYLDRAKGFGVKKGPVLGTLYSCEFFIMYAAYALCFWYGIKLLRDGQVDSGGTIFTTLFSVVIGTSALTMIAPSIQEFSKAAAAAHRVFEVLDRQVNIDAMSDKGKVPEPGPGQFSLRNASFAYPARPTVKVLDDMSLDFDAGKTSAIVGASGSGKSTIVALLERWYDAHEGQVLLDGLDIRELNVRWLRSQIGYVQQEPVLFNDTVYNNVVHGLYGTSMDELPESQKRELVKAACIESNADSFIEELPHGYDTNVGERGGLVSGGQKQRIAIARSIVKNPRILLLDEATSALDPKAEEIVQAALDKVSQSRTTIMIAHKLSTVKKADKIMVLSQGRVIESGNHSSLVEKNGAYAALVNAQTLTAHDDDTAGNDNEHQEVGDGTNALALEKSLTRVKTTGEGQMEAEEDITRKISLVKCVWLVLYEHRNLWPYFLAGAIACIGGGAVFPLQAFIFSRIVTVFQLPPDLLESRGNFWALIFFILALGVLFSYASIGLFFTIAAFKASRVYRSEYFGAMLRQDVGFFDAPDHSAGALTSRLSTDPQKLQDLISANMGLILIVIVNLVSSIILSIAVGWKLALVAIAGCIPPLFFAGFMRMRFEVNSQDRLAKPYSESARFVAEAVGAIRTVSSLTLESKVLDHYRTRLEESVLKAHKNTVVSMFLFALSDSLDLAAVALAFWWGGRLLSQGEYSVGVFFIVFIAIVFGGQAAGFLFGFTLNTTKAHGAANHIIHLRNKLPPINSATGEVPDLSASGATDTASLDSSDDLIVFDNVHFSYPRRPAVPVLRGLNMRIKRGQNVGIVGASGCGKTTVIALLERFYDIQTSDSADDPASSPGSTSSVNEKQSDKKDKKRSKKHEISASTPGSSENYTHSGTLRIAGTDIRKLDPHALRAQIGLVSQDTTVYQGSIHDNVLIGTADGSERYDTYNSNPATANPATHPPNSETPDPTLAARVQQACTAANIDTFIRSLPEGYDSDAGAHGLALSGGQRQRLALARALVRSPRLLLLDEATSALDTQGERAVQGAIRDAAVGRTVVSVAHRLSTVKECDVIFVLDKGRVVESGSHEELLRLGGVYRRMVEGQSLDREVA